MSIKNENALDCYVCQEDQQLIETCGDIKHMICQKCKDKWLETSRKCPICRKLMIGFDQELDHDENEYEYIFLSLNLQDRYFFFVQLTDMILFFIERVRPILMIQFSISSEQCMYFLQGWFEIAEQARQQWRSLVQAHLPQQFQYTELDALIELQQQIISQTKTDQEITEYLIDRLTKPLEEYIQLGQSPECSFQFIFQEMYQ